MPSGDAWNVVHSKSSEKVLRRSNVPAPPPPAAPIGRGLVNLGVTCHLNSALQALANSPDLVRAMRASPHGPGCTLRTGAGPAADCVLCALEKHVLDDALAPPPPGATLSARRPPIAPVDLYRILQGMHPDFFSKQQDPLETMRIIFAAMKRACPPASSAAPFAANPTTPAATYPFEVSTGTCQSKVTCGGCGGVTITVEPYDDLGLAARDVMLLRGVVIE
jgi:uncharacterized UBP type Zn finger protein